MYVVTAIRRRGATHAVSLVEFTWNMPRRRAFDVSTSGSERAFAIRYMLINMGIQERDLGIVGNMSEQT